MSTSTSADKMSFTDAILNRHTYYGLSKQLSLSDARIKELVTTALLHTPSSFNSQSTRLILLLGAEHTAFWDITRGVLKSLVNDEEKFKSTSQKLDGFSAGYGTVLFYEDQSTVKEYQKKFPLYSDKFPQWSEHTSAMHQFVIWTALEAEGLGANLQHYNPVVDEKVAERFDVPNDWTLIAQLVFGGRVGGPALVDKPQKENRLKVFGEKSI
jgi:predicted oxidoreductase (fatty acid repression mutant protein)